MWLECGVLGATPLPRGEGRGQIPLALNVMLKTSDVVPQVEGSHTGFKAGARAPPPQPPRVFPSVLGEEVSRETARPHLQGADGKGSETGVRSGWERGVQTTEFQCGGRPGPRRRLGAEGSLRDLWTLICGHQGHGLCSWQTRACLARPLAYPIRTRAHGYT